MSQFWYDHHTAQTLAEEVLTLCKSNSTRVACVACPSLYAYLKELDLLSGDANVFKLIGPILVKQDLAEAMANVRKRIEYISAELLLL